MSEALLIVDTGALINLYSAGGDAALEQLLNTGSRVVIPADMLRELREKGDNLSDAVSAFIARHEADGRVVSPEYDLGETLRQADPNVNLANTGDDAIKHLMAGSDPDAVMALRNAGITDPRFRLLTDDGKFFGRLMADGGFKPAALERLGMAEEPYRGTFEFLNERLANGDIPKQTYNTWRQSFLDAGRLSSLTERPDINFAKQILNDAHVNDFDESLFKKLITSIDGKVILKGGLVGLAVTVANKLGIIGDVLSFGITAAQAAELRENGDENGATETWVKYVFETAGGIAGGALGAVAAAYALKGAGGFWGPILGGLAGGVLGSSGGADMGAALYKAYPEIFDPVFGEIYAIADQLASTELPPAEAFATAFIGSFGFTMNPVEGTDGNDWLLGSKWGVRNGNGGDDVLIGWKPSFVAAGAQVDPGNPDSETAQTDLRLQLNGGDGDDSLVAIGGEGAITVGGEGRDFLLNTSYKGQLYGDSIDGTGAQDSDVFWWSSGSFIMDAGKNDILQMYGIPLTGGTTFFGGGQVRDWMMPFVTYGMTKSGQLLVSLGDCDPSESEESLLSHSMVVQNYTSGGFKSDSTLWLPERGDLGMTFRITTVDERIGSGKAKLDGAFAKAMGIVWGELVARLEAMMAFAKMIQWKPADDPLVLDLDGDGIETSSRDDSTAHFDLDGDYFAEKTSWVGADDGLLVMDRDGNGSIDDISELFGAPGGSGFAELNKLDTNGDGRIDSDDADFLNLQVWRDLNQDGISGVGELFTLAQLGITGINLQTTALNVETPSGNHLRAQVTFERADGSTGTVFEALFNTNPIDSRYRGDGGTADWSGDVKAHGYGRLTDLSVAMANDLRVNSAVTQALAAMTIPDLDLLREQAAPLFGAWAATQTTTRELVAVLVNTDGGKSAVLDHAVYLEDTEGGYWRLNSGNAVLGGDGQPITRPTLEDVLGQAATNGASWRLEQAWSPSDRSSSVTQRQQSPYLVRVADGRATVLDHGIYVPDEQGGYWRLASGTAVTAADGQIIVRPTLDDITAQSVQDGQQWRVEALGSDSFIGLPFDKVAIYLVDGIVTNYSVYVEDAQGGFHVWAENLDRALELQQEQGQTGGFALRNYAIDLDTLPELGATRDSYVRAEILSIDQFRYATAAYGIEFKPDVLHATVDDHGLLHYSSGGSYGSAQSVANDTYVSTIRPTIEFFDLLYEQYDYMSRAVTVRLASQGALAQYFRGVEYDAEQDAFVPTANRELAPMLEAIFEDAPSGRDDTIAYLTKWNEILEVVYPDYKQHAATDLSQNFLFQMIVAAYENVGVDAEILKVAELLGVDEERIIQHATTDAVVNGTDGDDIIYLTGGDQTYYGGTGKDVYVVGEHFGHDTIEDVEGILQRRSPDSLRFAHVTSDQVYATKDGLDLILQVIGTDDVLRIKNQFDGKMISLFDIDISPDTEMVAIYFADGVTWDQMDIAWATSHPLDSGDVVVGTQTVDVLDGGKGDDILRGGRDSDWYIFQRGYDHDIIDDQNDDILQQHYDFLRFGAGISIADLKFSRQGRSDDLHIEVLQDGALSGDSIDILGRRLITAGTRCALRRV